MKVTPDISPIYLALILICGCAPTPAPEPVVAAKAAERTTDQASPATPCEKLGRDECFAREECRGLYGTDSGGPDGMVNQVQLFQGCYPINEELLKLARRVRRGCKDTGGEWERRNSNEPGKCNCNPNSKWNSLTMLEHLQYGQSYFMPKRGCVSLYKICRSLQGKWEIPKVTGIAASGYTPQDCRQDRKRLRLHIEDARKCLTITFDESVPKCLINGKPIKPSVVLEDPYKDQPLLKRLIR